MEEIIEKVSREALLDELNTNRYVRNQQRQ